MRLQEKAKMPPELRKKEKSKKFKWKLKSWIKENISIQTDWQFDDNVVAFFLPHPGFWVASVVKKVILLVNRRQ